MFVRRSFEVGSTTCHMYTYYTHHARIARVPAVNRIVVVRVTEGMSDRVLGFGLWPGAVSTSPICIPICVPNKLMINKSFKLNYDCIIMFVMIRFLKSYHILSIFRLYIIF